MYIYNLIKILSWSIRGIRGKHKSVAVSKIIKKKDLDFFRVVEAKHYVLDETINKFWWNNDDID